jgi:hypothetical protein
VSSDCAPPIIHFSTCEVNLYGRNCQHTLIDHSLNAAIRNCPGRIGRTAHLLLRPSLRRGYGGPRLRSRPRPRQPRQTVAVATHYEESVLRTKFISRSHSDALGVLQSCRPIARVNNGESNPCGWLAGRSAISNGHIQVTPRSERGFSFVCVFLPWVAVSVPST